MVVPSRAPGAVLPGVTVEAASHVQEVFLTQVKFLLRFGKILRLGRARATASLDLYNALNANPVVTQSTAFATWRRPQSILNARFAKDVV